MDRERFVRDSWEALAAGDLRPFAQALAPDARWRAVVDGPWNCGSRDAIVEAMARNLENGLAGELEEIVPVGSDRLIVAFRPARHAPGAWPLDDGIRYLVLTFAGEQLREMKGCATHAAAHEYAATAGR